MSLVDIFPTVLDLMDIDAPSRLDLAGNSLLPILRDENLGWYDRAAGKGVAMTTIYGQVSLRAQLRAFLLDGGDDDDRISGQRGADTLVGGAGNDDAAGGAGNDRLHGGTSRDTLGGGDGADTLTGGSGADRLIGGADHDIFDFNAATESAPTGADSVADFTGAGAASGDLIDLSGVDANAETTGDQEFVFGGITAGCIRLLESSGNTIVLGNTDDDIVEELRIVIHDGAERAMSYTAADFIL